MLSLISLLLIHQTFGGKVCSYLGMEGIAYPVDTCMYHSEVDPTDASNSVSFAFEFQCGDGTITAEYWEHKTACRGSPDLEMDDYYCAGDPDLTGQECKCIGRGAACDTFQIDFVKSKSCKEQEEEIAKSQSTAIVVNECVPNERGGSQMLTCDSDVLYMYSFATCEDCQSCDGTYATFDYSAFSDECFHISCSEGVRRKELCEARGVKAKANQILNDDYAYSFGINAVEKYYGIDALDVIGDHIKNHHLFVQDIISKHEPSIIVNKNKAKMTIHKIFGNDNIFKSPVLYIIGGVLIVMICVAAIAMLMNRGGYEKVIDHDIHT